MNKALQILAVLAIAIFIAQGASAAEPIPGDSCTAGEEDNFLRSGGKEIPTGHFIVCKSGTWRSILSWDAAAAITKIGNLTCVNGEILKFNGTTWACATDSGGTLPALTSANIWVGNGSNAATAVAMSGDATLSNAGVLTIGSNAVGSAEITNASVALADLSATGTASATTYLRGDNTWAAITAGDAPTLDGLDSTQFLRSDADDSTSGRIYATGGLPASQVMATATGSLGAFEARAQGSAGTAGAAFITFHRPSAYAAYFGIDTDNQLKFGGWSAGAASYKVWHAGNDGAASGLDADTLDGQDSAYFTDATNLASGTVATARMGSGTANGTTFLRGDNTWTSTLTGSITAQMFYHTSDERLKTNIREIVDPIVLIQALRGVRYDWKKNSQPALGFIAQDVEKIAPEAVSTGSDGMKAVEYDQLIAPLVEAVKAQQAMIKAQQARIDNLERTLQSAAPE